MPHKVHGFFNPQSILPAYFQEHKKPSHILPDDRPRRADQTASISSTSSQDSHEQAAMKKLVKELKKLKPSSSKASLRHVPATLNVKMESPPAVYYGQPSSSSGALISGQLKLYITEPSMQIADYQMKFTLETKFKKPFHANCAECSAQSHELASWTFLQGPTKLRKGEHCFPFSCLIKGDQPASIDGPLSRIQYNLHAVLTSVDGEKITLNETLLVRRALFASELPKLSTRLFPAMSLTAQVDLPSVIYPIGQAIAKLRLDGIIRREEGSKVQHQWRLNSMRWLLEETHKVISPACPKHAAKMLAKSTEAKLSREMTVVRSIGAGHMESGWKTDYDPPCGTIELEFPIYVYTYAGATCDVKAEDVITVSHRLTVELVVGEEWAPENKPQQSTPFGPLRLLRMLFNVIVTERAGLGISWDEEQPPTYSDVPASPPGYEIGDIREYIGSPLTSSSLPSVPDYEHLPS